MAKTLRGVEIFAEGNWNGIPFSASDLDMLASSFDALGLSMRVPLKLGHEGPDARDAQGNLRDPLDQLAMGWVTRVYRDGDKLLADWEVPDPVARLISDGYLNHVSVELLKDVRAGTRVIPWVLDAVALLGSDQPAVGILKDLRRLTGEESARMRTSLSYGGRSAFSRGDGTKINFTGDRTQMADENQTALKELADKVTALTLRVTKQDEEAARLTADLAKARGVEAKFTALKDEVAKDKLDAHRRAVVAALEASVVSKDILPAARERFTRVYKVEDDEAVLAVTLDDVATFVKENPNPHKKRTDATAKVVSLSRATDDVPPGTAVEDELRMRVEASLREDKINEPTSDDWQRATLRLFRANPEFGSRYRSAVNAAIAHPSATRQ